jgi:hypothetical protein
MRFSGPAHNAIIPVFLRDTLNREIGHVGTCVWIRVKERNFLLTAAHLVDLKRKTCYFELPAGTEMMPLSSGFSRVSAVRNLGSKPMELDAAYCQISDELVFGLSARYAPIDPSGIDVGRLQPGALCVVAGYPCERAIASQVECSVPQFNFHGDGADERLYRKFGYDREIHSLVKFGRRNALTSTGGKGAPRPQGMSGGGIYSFNPKSLASPWKLNAIFTEWRNQKAIYAGTRIEWFLVGIALNNPGL